MNDVSRNGHLALPAMHGPLTEVTAISKDGGSLSLRWISAGQERSVELLLQGGSAAVQRAHLILARRLQAAAPAATYDIAA